MILAVRPLSFVSALIYAVSYLKKRSWADQTNSLNGSIILIYKDSIIGCSDRCRIPASVLSYIKKLDSSVRKNAIWCYKYHIALIDLWLWWFWKLGIRKLLKHQPSKIFLIMICCILIFLPSFRHSSDSSSHIRCYDPLRPVLPIPTQGPALRICSLCISSIHSFLYVLSLCLPSSGSYVYSYFM